MELRRPLSFVVVIFSDEYLHNILRSECVRDPRNQLVLVDNTANLHYANLSEAIHAGLEQARHDLVAVVHEDVYLPLDWQANFEASLAALEQHDPAWALIGTTGWTAMGALVGHSRDPHAYRNTFRAQPFTEVSRLDEQVLVLRRGGEVLPDPDLPSIHHIGRDLPLVARGLHLKSYVVDAMNFHKYADAKGMPIRTADDSPKIKDRSSFTYLADRACADQYFYRKWPGERPAGYADEGYDSSHVPPDVLARLDSPVVLLAQGGSGSRLLSLLGTDAGLFIGSDINLSGDCLEMRMAVYQGVIEKYACKASWQRALTVPRLRQAAAAMLVRRGGAGLWGFKLPECMFLVPELNAAFPNARYVHLIRDPLSTCLRRTHMTARLDNHIGRVTLALGYRYSGVDVATILQDSPALHMAHAVRHQVESVCHYGASALAGRYWEVRFEDVLADPEGTLGAFAERLGVTPVAHDLSSSVDVNRALRPVTTYPADVVAQVEGLLAPLRRELGYVVSRGAGG